MLLKLSVARIKEYYNRGMDDQENPLDNDELVHLITESGFTIVPMQTIIDALAQMEQYLMDQAGISQEELENYLERLQNLIGLEESYKLELDEILSWIKAFQDN